MNGLHVEDVDPHEYERVMRNIMRSIQVARGKPDEDIAAEVLLGLRVGGWKLKRAKTNDPIIDLEE